jgi:FlaG/FlaF family flagellin (archaellin)
MIQQKESAVSPVIGVMLMLVVVIIIAAIVSAISGGLASPNQKAPQATIQGTYSSSAGVLQMFHAGGDELPTSQIFVIIREKDEQAGGFLGTMSRTGTNKSNIFDASGSCFVDYSTGIVKKKVWLPGETMYYTGDTGKGLGLKTPVGGSFTLEVDTIDGKLISKTDVKIGP